MLAARILKKAQKERPWCTWRTRPKSGYSSKQQRKRSYLLRFRTCLLGPRPLWIVGEESKSVFSCLYSINCFGKVSFFWTKLSSYFDCCRPLFALSFYFSFVKEFGGNRRTMSAPVPSNAWIHWLNLTEFVPTKMRSLCNYVIWQTPKKTQFYSCSW